VLNSAGKTAAGLIVTTTSTTTPSNFTVLGNIVSGTIETNGAALSAPWAALNVIE
jgi:hypothetical protein